MCYMLVFLKNNLSNYLYFIINLCLILNASCVCMGYMLVKLLYSLRLMHEYN